jgi:predicted nucleotidyltransferase
MDASVEVLTGINEELRRAIEKAAAALKAAGAREVYLFGSAAKGKVRPRSDIDFAVSGLPPRAFFQAMADACDALGRQLDLIDLDDDSPFARYLKEHGELVRVG